MDGKIEALSFSSAMHSLMAVQEDGMALTPLITWADMRSKKEAQEIIQEGGHSIYQETGTPIHPMTPLCKLRWIRKNHPDLLKKAFKFIGIKEFIWFKFFHEFAVDHSIASATGLFHTETRTWSTKALGAVGISEKQLSKPFSTLAIFKNPGAGVSKELGIPETASWIIGGSDGCLANLGSGAMDEKTLSLTIGTSGAVRKIVKKNSPDALGRTFH